MTLYQVENQWGGSQAAWHEGGNWVIGDRSNQNVVAIDVKSDNGGQTLNGTMTKQLLIRNSQFAIDIFITKQIE